MFQFQTIDVCPGVFVPADGAGGNEFNVTLTVLPVVEPQELVAVTVKTPALEFVTANAGGNCNAEV